MKEDDAVSEVKELLKAEGISEENNEQKAPREEKTSEGQQETRVLSEFEQEQAEKGWNPDGPKSAEEWARAEPLYEELKTRGRELKQMKRTIEELKEHMQRQEQAAYNRALKDLEEQRQQAVYNGDNELVSQIDQEKQDLNESVPVTKHEAVLDFEERHSDWLTDNSFEAFEMQKFAVERDAQLMSRKLSAEEHMKVLEEHIVKKFPNYFKKESESYRPSGSAVESGHSNNVSESTSRNKKYSLSDLNPEQKQTARDFERLGVMKIDEYIKQLKDSGDLE